MALFRKKTEDKKDGASPKDSQKKTAVEQAETAAEGEKKTVDFNVGGNVRKNDPSSVLLRPRITEKATFSAENNTYVFEVSPRAGKIDVKRAVEKIYKVTPEKINIVKIPAKIRESRWRRMKGVKSGGKKAYVHLKKGDSIEIV